MTVTDALTSLGLLVAGKPLPGFGTVGELWEHRSKSLQWIEAMQREVMEWCWCGQEQKAFGSHGLAVLEDDNY